MHIRQYIYSNVKQIFHYQKMEGLSSCTATELFMSISQIFKSNYILI